jgi:hypothetical protein
MLLAVGLCIDKLQSIQSLNLRHKQHDQGGVGVQLPCCFWSGCWAPPGIGRVACFTGEAVPQAPGSWVRPAESCVVSQYNCAPPVKPQKKK